MFLRKTVKTSIGQVLLVPKQAFGAIWKGLAKYHDSKVEGCCFLYGPRSEANECLITHVVFPKQVNHRGNFKVTPGAIAEMSAATRPVRLMNRVQIHTHPGDWVDHSWYDDEHAISQNVISIVLPHYGRVIHRWPDGIGVHEFQDDRWHLLSSVQIQKKIRIVGGEVSLMDLR